MSREYLALLLEQRRALLKQAEEYEHLASALRMQAKAIEKMTQVDNAKVDND